MLQGVAALERIEQKLEEDSRPAKNRRSAQDIWIFDDHAVPGTHKISITESKALSSCTLPYLSLAKTIAVIMLQQPRPPVPFDRFRPSVLRYQAQARGEIAEHKS